MRHYEAMYIVDADTPDEVLDTIVEKYSKVVTEAGGEVVEAGKWDKGRRPLAYDIAKKREGNVSADAVYVRFRCAKRAGSDLQD